MNFDSFVLRSISQALKVPLSVDKNLISCPHNSVWQMFEFIRIIPQTEKESLLLILSNLWKFFLFQFPEYSSQKIIYWWRKSWSLFVAVSDHCVYRILVESWRGKGKEKWDFGNLWAGAWQVGDLMVGGCWTWQGKASKVYFGETRWAYWAVLCSWPYTCRKQKIKLFSLLLL